MLKTLQVIVINSRRVADRAVWLAKNGSVFSSSLQKNCSFWLWFYKINRGFSFSVRLGLDSYVNVDAIFHLRLYGMTLEMTYFRAELVQLIVSQSDSELQAQRYGMKKNTLTVDPIMLQDELCMRQREKPSPNC